MAGISTILFTDVAGSTEMLARLGDDAAEAVRRSHFERMRDLTYGHRGRVVKGLGDGLMVSFGSPLDAVRCAIAMQQAEARADSKSRVGLRVGLDVGEPIEDDGDLHGTAVVVAKRLCDAAEPGQILISDLLARLVQPRIGTVLEAVGPLELKGLPGPTLTHRVSYADSSDAAELEGLDHRAGTEVVAPMRVALPSRLAEVARRPLVGRGEEVRRLREAWRAACAGAPGVVSIGGEPGIGKSRLVGALAQIVADSGGSVLLGECEEDRQLVYQPWATALGRDMREATHAQLRRRIGDSGELTRLVPGVRERLPELPEPVHDDPEGQRGRLFAAVARYLDARAKESPLLLLLEDVHWADQPTLDLLRFLIRELEQVPVLTVLTFREREVDGPLADLLVALPRRSGYESLRLAGLGLNEVELLTHERLGGSPLPSGFVEALREHTDGNAFFLEEVLRDLKRDGIWSVASVGRVPASVQATIARSLAQLPDATRELLTIASIIGRRFELALLSATSGRDEDDVLDCLEVAVTRGLLAEIAGASGEFAFVHALVREVLLSGIGQTREARIHLRVAEALEARCSEHDNQPTAALARHFLAGGAAAAGKAARYAEAAGVSALERLGYGQAADFFQSALTALERDKTGGSALGGRLHVRRGEALARAGRMIDARASFKDAVEIGRALGDGLLVAEAARGVGEGWLNGGSPDVELLDALAFAIELLDSEHEALRIHLGGRLAAEQRHLLPWDERERLTAAALEQAREGRDERMLAESLIARHQVMVGVPRVPERVALIDELIDRARRNGDRDVLLQGLQRRYSDFMEMGDRDRAEASLLDYEAVATEVGQPFFLYSTVLTYAGFTSSTGTAAEAQAHLERAAELFGAVEPLPILVEPLQAVTAGVLWNAGQNDVVLAIVEQAVTSPEIDEEQLTPAWEIGYATALGIAGRTDEALALLDRLSEKGYCPPGEPLTSFSLCNCARTAYLVGGRQHASRLTELLTPFIDGWGFMHLGGTHVGPVPLFLGLLAALDQRTEDADRLLERAVSMAASFRSPRFEAEALAYRAEIRLRLNDPEGARTYARRARELVEGTGWEPVLGETERLV